MIQEQLQARGATLESDLKELRERPRIPEEYQLQVEEEKADLEATIAGLEEELQRVKMANTTLEAAHENAQYDMDMLKAASEESALLASEAEARAAKATEAAALERSKSDEMERANKTLQGELAKKPKEVTRTVYVASPGKQAASHQGPVTDALLL